MKKERSKIPVIDQDITREERAWIDGAEAKEASPSRTKKKGRTYKGHMVSMSDAFIADMEAFLEEFPEEGSRSGLITRAVTDYIRRVRTERR